MYANGIGSVLSIPNLSSITGANNSRNLQIYALNGGHLDLGGVTNIVGTLPEAGGGITAIQSSGTPANPSVLNLSQLISFTDQGANYQNNNNSSSLETDTGGQLLVSNLTVLAGPSVYANSGTTISLPKLISYVPGVSGERDLQANGVGSVLNIPNLPYISGANNGRNVYLTAVGGGQLNLSGVTNIVGTLAGASGNTQVNANGVNSIIDLLGLNNFTSPYGTSSIKEQNGGIVLINSSVAISGVTYLLIGNASLPNGAIGVSYSSALVPLGGKPPFTWSLAASNLPPGLSLSPASGVISGTPTTNGVYPFQVQVTDSTGNYADANLSLTITTPAAGFSATQSMAIGYVSAATNTLSYQINYPAGREMYSLFWQPSLPPGWTLVSVTGDGDPELLDGQIVFTGDTLPNPLNITCGLAIPAGQTGTNEISGSVSYWMNGMDDIASVSASPNPLLVAPAKPHDADYEAPFWVIDGIEVSRPLAYWRAQAYQIDTNTVDGYSVGSGNTNGPLYTADFEAPFWVIDGTEVNRVLAYWRAGAYHPDTNGVDGYAPGVLPAPPSTSVVPNALTLNEATVTQTGPALYLPGATLVFTNTVQYDGNLLSLLLRPNVPAGWALKSVSGPGSPEAVAGEIVLVGRIPASSFQLTYAVQVPDGVSGPQPVGSQLEYQFAGMANPSTTVSPASVVQTPVVQLAAPVLTGSQFVFNLTGQAGTYLIQTSTDLKNWTTLATVTVGNGGAQVADGASATAKFYRAVLVATP